MAAQMTVSAVVGLFCQYMRLGVEAAAGASSSQGHQDLVCYQNAEHRMPLRYLIGITQDEVSCALISCSAGMQGCQRSWLCIAVPWWPDGFGSCGAPQSLLCCWKPERYPCTFAKLNASLLVNRSDATLCVSLAAPKPHRPLLV